MKEKNLAKMMMIAILCSRIIGILKLVSMGIAKYDKNESDHNLFYLKTAKQ